MIAAWSGSAGSLSTSITSYAFVTNPLSVPWLSGPNLFNTYQTCFPVSENIVITGITAWVATAPGVGASWTLSIQSSTNTTYQATGTFTNTSASAVISGTNTTASWSGSASIAQSTFITVAMTPSAGTAPAATANVYWIITYKTAGNFYLMPIGNAQAFATGGSGNYYEPAFSYYYNPPSSAATTYAIPVPANLTVTKMLAWAPFQGGAPFGASSKTFSVYNASTSTASSFSSVVTGNTTGLGNIGSGSISFTAGQLVCIQVAYAGNPPWTADYACMTVVPGNSGEVVTGYATSSSPNNATTQYEDPNGAGNNGWNSTESAVYARFPGSTLKNLYVSLQTAPSGSTSYAFTLRQGGTASTGITTTISGTNTTGNDTNHSYALSAGTFLDIQSVPTSSPAATNGVAFSFVQVIPQPGSWFYGAGGF